MRHISYSTTVMEYAVILTGGKQYIAVPGQELVIERLSQEEGDTVSFDQVLLTVNGKDVVVGAPTVANVAVQATLLKNDLGDKLRIFKYRPKSRYRRTMGHRQHQTVVRIDSIGATKATKTAPKKEKAAQEQE